MDLNECRRTINDIDEQIVALFVRRMNVAAAIAAYKRAAGMPVLDRAREQAVLDRVAGLAGEELGDYARALYERMMAVSRDYQAKLLASDGTGDGA